MMRSLNLLYIFFCLLLLVVSCKKESDKEKELKYPISLNYKSYSRGKMRMWTKDGEVLDQQKINSFVGNSFDNIFNAYFHQVNFKSADSAEIRFPAALFGLWTYKVLDTANIEFKGDVQLFSNTFFGNQETLDRSFLIYKTNSSVQGVRIIPQPTLMPPVIYRTNMGFKAVGNRKKLSIPGYLYRIRLYSRGVGRGGGHMFGEFNENFLKELLDRDTLVIQVTNNNWVL
ncbi:MULTISPECIES: hypothetical protein [unclassified Pedobacter]|uniref:hypothetical protein n=1 Tax=unclassified Pedobacter TaxID=2628915 RepID=UPI00141EDF07|nr:MULTISPECIES: hypothetical protein [unclassified Pedobacter]NII83890.1 hypothetical protein [Pedobacter sp. SG908]NMN37764.1 hypothetical protein [Pedobacter sp. SG918]